MGVAVLNDAEKAFASAVDLIDESHVFVAFAVGDFIDTEGGDVLQNAVFEAIFDDPFYRTADSVPIGMEASGCFFPAHPPGP